MPFAQLVEALQPERDLSRQPLVQVMFVLQNSPMPVVNMPGLTLKPMAIETETAKFDLTLSMEEISPEQIGILEYNTSSLSLEKTESRLIGVFEYNTDLFDAATIRRMMGHFQTLLEGIVANPDRPISDLPLLTKEERQQLLVEWLHDTDFEQ